MTDEYLVLRLISQSDNYDFFKTVSEDNHLLRASSAGRDAPSALQGCNIPQDYRGARLSNRERALRQPTALATVQVCGGESDTIAVSGVKNHLRHTQITRWLQARVSGPPRAQHPRSS
ncbi:hypothetical protein RRG08_016158 [Elysia crispata]|uniref:Uncharacterized protein n=1 Tax=Elysia crispata TaxID=231223 RepID=A0AAE0Z425_9GAST|nr:hypothetical protein RRG08_016158 [Elysia crispata]